MTRQCWIGTRKGLLKARQSPDRSWSLSAACFPGEPVSAVLPANDQGMLYAALNLGHFGPKLHRSADGGRHWEECGTPAFPKSEGVAGSGDGNGGESKGEHEGEGESESEREGEGESERESEGKHEGDGEDAKSVDFIWIMEYGADGCLWAGTVPAGLFRSRDQGDSWEFINSLNESPGAEEWFGGGFDDPGLHSIQIDPRDPRKLTVAISCGGVWFSEDDGANWTNKAQGMRAEYLPPEQAGNVNTQDPHRLLACPAAPDRLWAQHHNGIFRFDEADGRWREILDVAPSSFGFALAVHPRRQDTAWFVPAVKDECRIPVDNKLVVNRTVDGGDSFQALSTGLPQEPSYDLIYRHCLEVDTDGRTLMMGSTSGNLWASADGGESWQTLSTNLAEIHCIRFTRQTPFP